MTQVLPKLLTFEAFLDWLPQSDRAYELMDGVIIQMTPTGRHEQVVGLIAAKLTLEFARLGRPWFIPQTAFVKPDSDRTGYQPDVLLLNREALKDEPLWLKAATITTPNPIQIAVEVVSSNWRDDYLKKLGDYEAMGIPEYWIVDYLALGATRYLGNPKQPKVSVYRLVEKEYQVEQFQGEQAIASPTFPDLHLTVAELVQIAQEA